MAPAVTGADTGDTNQTSNPVLIHRFQHIFNARGKNRHRLARRPDANTTDDGILAFSCAAYGVILANIAPYHLEPLMFKCEFLRISSQKSKVMILFKRLLKDL